MSGVQWFALSLLVVVGCSSPSRLVLLVDSTSSAPLQSLEVSVFDVYGQRVQRTIAPATLPGSLEVNGLPAPAQLTVVVRGGTALVAAARVASKAGATVDVPLHLGATLTDGDGDGVPDLYDDCPAVADPTQANARGVGPGDACAVGDGGVVGDGATADMTGGVTCPKGAVFCESFEDYALNPGKWTADYALGSANLCTDQFHDGVQSLHSTNNHLGMGDVGAGAINEHLTLPSVPNMFIRAWVKVPSGFGSDAAALIKVQQTAMPNHGVTIQLDSQAFVIYNDNTTTATGPGGTFPFDEWFCVEWQISVGSKTSTSRVWIDSSEITALGATQDTSEAGIDQVEFGLKSYASVPNINSRELWIDQIAIGSQRLGCN